jgi:endogenous inhibitor of DNA gyrase (YacG/DUF329 family)
MATKTVSCPACSAAVQWSASSPFRPFCSERCKLMDLGAWATEKYRIAKPHDQAEEGAPPTQSGEGN